MTLAIMRINVKANLFLLLLIQIISYGCTTLPPAPPQPVVNSLTPAESGVITEISKHITGDLKPYESAYLLLSRNDDALNWRLALADHATTSIDAQYFIWQNDATGNLLFDRLLKAADRGVRVRLLVDDIWLAANDEVIAAIDDHPNFAIKIFNPTYTRHAVAGAFEFLAYFQELNRRMHNKLFIVDNRMAIVGGRNIGNPYFGLSEKYNFRDLDVLTTGPVVEEISSAFDEYWNAELAYPGRLLSDKYSYEDLDLLRQEIKTYFEENAELLANYPLAPRDWSKEMHQLTRRIHSGEGHFLQDDPIVVHGEEVKLIDMLDTLAEPSHEELMVVSPYLIPVGDMLQNMAALNSEGVDVKILTASMGSNNHTAAHSHYKKYRRRILETGAELYEFRHDPSQDMRDEADVPPVESDFISLHVKAMVGDRQRCFIGSLNLDPRALVINTENGLYIESPELAKQLAAMFDAMMAPENAWRVYLDKEEQTLRWQSSKGTVDMQPARSFGQRISDFFFRLLPIESQL
jgi:putative cardiolipin synthase